MRSKIHLFFNTFWGTILIVLLLDRIQIFYSKVVPTPNRLCVGECYLFNKDKPNSIYIKWELTPNLGHKTKAEIYQLRKDRVNDNASLVIGKYMPSNRIYSKIEDNLKWWGFDGYYQHLRSIDIAEWSIAGRSLRGEEIYNPFYLVSFKPLTYTVENPKFKWNSKVMPAIAGSNCPFWPRKSDVLWKPGEKKAEVMYFLQEYVELLDKNSCLQDKIGTKEIVIGLDPVNAQDFGFSYLSFSENESMNISYDNITSEFIELAFYYHPGTSCRTPEGCNNISPLVKDLFGNIKTTDLPARLVIKLWDNKPLDKKSDSSFSYIIHLR